METEAPIKVKDLLVEQRWCQGAYARRKGGQGCLIRDIQACRWCLSGAIELVYVRKDFVRANEVYTKVHDYLKALYPNKKPREVPGITQWNDTYASFEDVRKLVEALDI